jgi:hypothetical protein
MGCSRGEASPNPHTKLRLFADSGGYCQNPECNLNLFLTIGASDVHIAEMAHIISAGDTGPRSGSELTTADKGSFSNLILLCPTCHTKIDKAESEFPDNLVKSWKNYHSQKINSLFNIKQYTSRIEARKALVPILAENKTIFEIYGPLTDERFNPESEMPAQWISKIHQYILPNNRKLFKILESNYNLLTDGEKKTTEIFKQHVLDFEAKHINNENINGIQFPSKLHLVFTN